MRKLLLLLTLTISANTYGQEQIPNGDFENWNSDNGYENPDNWETLNFLSQFGSPLTVIKTDTANNGNHACEMVSKTFFNSNVVGFIFTGSIENNIYGVPFHSKPTRVQFDYKAFPKLGDSGYFVITLSHWDALNEKRDSIAYAEMYFDETISQYTLADIPLSYSINNITPDTLGIYIASSFDTTSVGEGSRLIVDNIRLSYFPVGVNVLTPDNLSFYPNPANSFTTFNSTEDLNIKVYNINGQSVLTSTGKKLNTSTLPKGIYYMLIEGVESKRIYTTQKLIIQ